MIGNRKWILNNIIMYIPLDWIISGIILLIIVLGLNKKSNIDKEED